MHRILNHATSVALAGLLAVGVASTANAQKKYDPGATDTEIKIGNIMPYSGPASAYATTGKTIGVLYQNDDFGNDYDISLREGLGDQAGKLIVIESSYETSSPTVDSQVVQIKGANPDIFVNISTPKFAAQSIKKIGELKWN